MAERSRLIDGRLIAADDIVLGVASSGLHSNGYSLARKAVSPRRLSPACDKLEPDEKVPAAGGVPISGARAPSCRW